MKSFKHYLGVDYSKDNSSKAMKDYDEYLNSDEAKKSRRVTQKLQDKLDAAAKKKNIHPSGRVWTSRK